VSDFGKCNHCNKALPDDDIDALRERVRRAKRTAGVNIKC